MSEMPNIKCWINKVGGVNADVFVGDYARMTDTPAIAVPAERWQRIREALQTADGVLQYFDHRDTGMKVNRVPNLERLRDTARAALAEMEVPNE